MQRYFCIAAVCMAPVFFAGCGKKDLTPAALGESKLPPLANAGDAPEFVRSLSLVYPQAELYRVENAPANQSGGKTTPALILQKTNHPLAHVSAYYSEVMKKHGFSETTHLEQSGGALLQYERVSQQGKDSKELISVDISKLPYAENLLIRIGRSEVDYSRGRPE